MRYIKIPPPITIERDEDAEPLPPGAPEPKPISLSNFIRRVISGDPRTIAEHADVMKWDEITTAVKDLKTGDLWEMNEGNWEFLSKLVRTFPNYHPAAKVSLLPLIKAVTGASAKSPAEQAAAEEEAKAKEAAKAAAQ